MKDIKAFCPASLPSVIGKTVEEYNIDATIETLKNIINILETTPKEEFRKEDNDDYSASSILDKDVYIIYKKSWHYGGNEFINSFFNEEDCLKFLKMSKLEYLYQLRYETLSNYYYEIKNTKIKNAIDNVM